MAIVDSKIARATCLLAVEDPGDSRVATQKLIARSRLLRTRQIAARLCLLSKSSVGCRTPEAYGRGSDNTISTPHNAQDPGIYGPVIIVSKLLAG